MKKLLASLHNRADLAIIVNWIDENARVLDLGCGDGTLLECATQHKNIHGMGVDIDLARITSCIQKGIPVIQQDLNGSFSNFSTQSFDYVILSQTVQEIDHPDRLIDEILRIGKYGIVSFPNFGHWKVRMNLALKGKMPKSRVLPYEWYDTPNIHMMTIRDFENFCRARGIKILSNYYINGEKFSQSKFMPNLFAEGCVALITK